MSSNQQIPLTDVRGVGPSAALRMKQCGIFTANQLAGMSIAQFKLSCPSLGKRGEAFVKAARRLLRRTGGATVPLNEMQAGCQVNSGPNVGEGRPVADNQVSRPAEAREAKKAKKNKSSVAMPDEKKPEEETSKSDEKKKRKKKDKLNEQEKREKKEKKEKKGGKKAKEGKKPDQKKKLDKKDNSSGKKKKKEKKRDKKEKG